MSKQVSTFQEAIASWPIFGGTSTEGGAAEETVVIEGKIVDKGKETDTGSAGGNTDDDTSIVNPNDPEAISKLTAQLAAANKLAEQATATANQYKTKEEQAARAQQTKEEQLQTDYDNALATIERMDAVIKNSALTNALLGQKDYEWHSVRQVMAELQEEEFEVTIDLDSGQAVVSGIENAAKRVARDCPWLVSKDKAKEQTTVQGNQNGNNGTRVSGRPPAPPANQQAKAAKRAELTKRFPVIQR